MWEAIASNQRRSRILIVLMGVLLILVGALIGLTVDPQWGGAAGSLVALAVWLVLWLTAVYGGDSILLSTAGAMPIQKEDAPRLWNVVEEMTIAGGLPLMPAIYLIESDALNAFAVGRKPTVAAVAVTSGLLKRLTRDELQGVIAHELSHIRNLDVRFMTLASVMVGAIAILADGFLRSLRFTGGRRSSRGSGSGQAQLIIFLLAIVVAILAPICAQILYFACSRRREFLADASAARLTRYPDGLASALEKIACGGAPTEPFSRALAPLFIVNPLQSGLAAGLFATHPPTQMRIEILRAMGGRAGYLDYESAYKKVCGEKEACLGARTLGEGDSVQARTATAEPEPQQEAIGRARDVAGLLGRLGQFLEIPCACGMIIKVPPEFKQSEVVCPRCGTTHEVPSAKPIEAQAAGAAREQTYQRKQAGAWESFRCACGQTVQLSPLFAGSHVVCPACKSTIMIAGAKPEMVVK